MEVEISGNSFDCSGDWLVALVADNSHVCSPRQGWRPTKSGSCRFVLITSYATTNAGQSERNDPRKSQNEASI